ncbi:MAG: endonuclease [Bacteroidota bacterium]
MKSTLFYKIGFGIALAISLYALAYAKPLSESTNKSAVIAFYNVENLFDTINDPDKRDDEFLPDSAKKWNSERYWAKQSKMAEVIAQIGAPSFPAIVGLCEVENIGVLEDLVKEEKLKNSKYEPVLIEGPDQRGIDVALLYSKKRFKVISSSSYTVELGEENRPTRDILHVRGKLKSGGPTVNVFVNHWPSRYGGAEKSEPKRMAAAKVLKTKTDSIAKVHPEELIICMGDFNDYPNNKSLTESLSAGQNKQLVNLMYGLKETKRGSYNYKGDWDFLDQIIVSKNLVDGMLPEILDSSTAPFFTDSMLYKHPKYGDIKPSRTYGGPNYYGGYSDHLPVFTVIEY